MTLTSAAGEELPVPLDPVRGLRVRRVWGSPESELRHSLPPGLRAEEIPELADLAIERVVTPEASPELDCDGGRHRGCWREDETPVEAIALHALWKIIN